MSHAEIDPEDPINLDASSSQELKRPVIKCVDIDPADSSVIPDMHIGSVRSKTKRREFLSQPFDSMDGMG